MELNKILSLNNNNKINKQCIEPHCSQEPLYNYIHVKYPIYCSMHKLDNMINVMMMNMCQYSECIVIANYNFKDQNKAMYCFAHKLDNMVNVRTNICQYFECVVAASFNFRITNNSNCTFWMYTYICFYIYHTI